MTTNDKQRITLFLHGPIAKHARAEAIIEDISFSNLVEKALTSYLPQETIIKKVVLTENS